jgi:predicted TIM-barrel fold metal-dependent hydrolase
MTIMRLIAAVAVALAAAGGASGASTARPAHHVVVVADPADAAQALAVGQRLRAPVRFPRGPTEQLGVTHLFAARGYTIVTVGVVRRVAVDPVAARYPRVRFVVLHPGIPRRVAACPPSC